jgi:gliding motility-associated-like protein
VQVSGPQVVCQLNQPFTYNTVRNPGCDLSPIWVYDTAFAVLQSYNSNSGIFTFRRTGTTRLYARINTGCYLYTDSIDVNIQSSPAVFSLGADTVLCAGDSLVLNAGTGFSSYQWQDGSADSVFVVHGPGIYYVQTTNLCGNVYNDTIHVVAAIIPPLNIGNDVNACINDTLRLMAQPGFMTYNWFPALQVTGNGQQAYVIPTGNMNVWVNVVTSDGCKKSDTLTITGISAPPVFLGRDTSFCLKDSVVLNAGAGYQLYNWSTGATGSSVTIKQIGTYWVKATAANGCTAKDTMRVIQTYALPQPALGNDFSLCTGSQQRLDPGAFSSYLWQNGSTAPFLNVSLPGTYHVVVSNANQCQAADTVVLLQVLPSPAGFLAGSDSICAFSSIELSPLQNFISYQWSTGARQKIISISSPGNYILTVVNSDGCSGKDTISIFQKNCFTGVFVPSAFTPNNDGRNDLFKPMLFGSVISLLFEVYDRSGQLVYRTSNPTSGWNGTVQGVQQSSGMYVWQCRYQLAGEEPGYKKGTVMLIR